MNQFRITRIIHQTSGVYCTSQLTYFILSPDRWGAPTGKAALRST